MNRQRKRSLRALLTLGLAATTALVALPAAAEAHSGRHTGCAHARADQVRHHHHDRAHAHGLRAAWRAARHRCGELYPGASRRAIRAWRRCVRSSYRYERAHLHRAPFRVACCATQPGHRRGHRG